MCVYRVSLMFALLVHIAAVPPLFISAGLSRLVIRDGLRAVAQRNFLLARSHIDANKITGRFLQLPFFCVFPCGGLGNTKQRQAAYRMTHGGQLIFLNRKCSN